MTVPVMNLAAGEHKTHRRIRNLCRIAQRPSAYATEGPAERRIVLQRCVNGVAIQPGARALPGCLRGIGNRQRLGQLRDAALARRIPGTSPPPKTTGWTRYDNASRRSAPAADAPRCTSASCRSGGRRSHFEDVDMVLRDPANHARAVCQKIEALEKLQAARRCIVAHVERDRAGAR